MIELSKNDIQFIMDHFIICKDLKSLYIDSEAKKVFLNSEDKKTLETFKRLKKGY